MLNTKAQRVCKHIVCDVNDVDDGRGVLQHIRTWAIDFFICSFHKNTKHIPARFHLNSNLLSFPKT